ncbi:MAG: UDP-N-acetylmuramoyl-L-alanyl-D-glutamate--2,6-diaminopimelate ligase [Deltaproteobacteria bacterium]|nr:UDP-N-acetylmuramoyl-L-alanyl-D-glutamate--2,6-diaminopimelate ligase [Deltaproteobacteria bacterium]
MKVSTLIEGVDILEAKGDTLLDVSALCYDSRLCKGGSLFVAVSGLTSDGHEFIDEAVQKGATCVVYEKGIISVEGVTSVKVRDSRLAMGQLGRNFFCNPSGDMFLIGVTGTNGKTTVTYILESVLREAGLAVGVIGTINYRYGGQVFQSLNTTPDSIDLQRILREMADAGITHVIMEVSSHAIDLKRVDSCEFDMGIFTNLTSEHLDYHGSIENYFLVKRRFFRELMNGGKKIINGDDPWGMRIIEEEGPGAVTFGIDTTEGYDVVAVDFALSMEGIRAKIKTSNEEFYVTSSMIGKYNLANILTSIAAAFSMNIRKEHITAGIEKVKNIPGRLERVNDPGEPSVFVDYAHTEDALRRTLENLADLKEGKIITVFGCGGDRDRTKRVPMGKIAIKLSDVAIITSDNPRTEDPLVIIDEIMRGIRDNTVESYNPTQVYRTQNGREFAAIADRREAIEKAVSMADPSDIVLIAGKGHEDYQILGTRRIPFDDRIVAREALARRRAGRKGL